MSEPQAAAREAPASAGLWLMGALLAAANFLAVLDTTIANVSVPNISGNLGASASQGSWVITSYSVAEAIIVPLTGWLAGRFGAVRVFVCAMVGFGALSASCGLAHSLGLLVTFRVMQGVAGGPLLPLSQTLLMHIFPKKQVPAAMALWVATTLTAPVAGPILGGYLCDHYGWPAIFYVNVPIAFACAPILFFLLRKKETAIEKKPVDVVGLGLLIVWVGALQLILDLGKDHGWLASPMICGLAITSAIGFAAFLIWELTDANPIVTLRVFLNRGFWVSVIVMAMGYGAFMAANVITPNWLQTNMGYTATWAGLACGMTGVLAIFAAPASAKLTAKLDVRALITFGFLWLSAWTFARAGMTSQVNFTRVALIMLFTGIGMPFFFLPLNTLALGSVDARDTAAAAGLLNFARTLSGAIGVSIVNTAWEDGGERSQAELSGLIHGAQEIIDGMMLRGANEVQAINAVTKVVQGQAIMLATDQLMAAAASVFLAGAVVVWLAPKPERVDGPSFGH
jgi:DHA2 family multidrug resistance protein